VRDGHHTLSAAASGGRSASITVATANGNNAQRYVSTTGRDSGTCATPATACASFDYAYDQAACGDLVQVAAGSYPQQRIADVIGKDGRCNSTTRVTFTPARNATVHVAGLQLGQNTGSGYLPFTGPQHVALVGNFLFDTPSNAGQLKIGPGSRDILIDGVTADGATIECGGCHDTTVANSTVENVVATSSLTLAPVELFGANDGIADYTPTNVTYTGDTFHNITTSNGLDWHVECMFIKDTLSVTVTNSRFYNCQVYDIFIQLFPNPGARLNNIRITNNEFGQAFQSWSSSTGFSSPNRTAVYWDQAGRNGYTSTGNVFAFNSTTLECAGCQNASKNMTAPMPSFNLDSGGRISATIVGNIGGNQACTAGSGRLVWEHNLTVSFSPYTFTVACGTNTNQAWNSANFGYGPKAKPSGHGLSLTAASPAIGLVPRAECEAALGGRPSDFTGKPRPNTNHSSACNAGAYENR
jgi:hypothetical protein